MSEANSTKSDYRSDLTLFPIKIQIMEGILIDKRFIVIHPNHLPRGIAFTVTETRSPVVDGKFIECLYGTNELDRCIPCDE